MISNTLHWFGLAGDEEDLGTKKSVCVCVYSMLSNKQNVDELITIPASNFISTETIDAGKIQL